MIEIAVKPHIADFGGLVYVFFHFCHHSVAIAFIAVKARSSSVDQASTREQGLTAIQRYSHLLVWESERNTKVVKSGADLRHLRP